MRWGTEPQALKAKWKNYKNQVKAILHHEDFISGLSRQKPLASACQKPSRTKSPRPKFKIPEEKIQTCLIFVALRGGINTGKSDSAIDYGKRDVFGTFEEHLQKVLEWKKDPEIFIKELLEQPTQDTLHEAIKNKLAN